MCDPRKLADAKKKYLNDWLNNAKIITDAIPKVQQQLDVAKWEASTLSDAPNEIVIQRFSFFCSSLEQDLETISHALPPMPKMDLKALDVSSGSTAATASGVWAVTNEAQQSDVIPIREWGARHSIEYLDLQDRLNREDEIIQRLKKLNPSLGNRFEQASADFRRCYAGTSNQIGAGIAMRNVLEQFKGELTDLARKHPREQKLKWADIADRLVPPGTPCDRFKKQEELRSYLQQRLSKLAKGQLQLSKIELQSIFAELVDHLYITLSLAQVS